MRRILDRRVSPVEPVCWSFGAKAARAMRRPARLKFRDPAGSRSASATAGAGSGWPAAEVVRAIQGMLATACVRKSAWAWPLRPLSAVRQPIAQAIPASTGLRSGSEGERCPSDSRWPDQNTKTRIENKKLDERKGKTKTLESDLIVNTDPTLPSTVMAGHRPGHPWIAGSSPAMTRKDMDAA
jgi:hypothetical protein